MEKKNIFEVIVGNIGTVYAGNNYMKAQTAYTTYRKQSVHGSGRAAGEEVTFLHNGTVRAQYIPAGART